MTKYAPPEVVTVRIFLRRGAGVTVSWAWELIEGTARVAKGVRKTFMDAASAAASAYADGVPHPPKRSDGNASGADSGGAASSVVPPGKLLHLPVPRPPRKPK